MIIQYVRTKGAFMYAVLILTISGTDTKHISVIDEDNQDAKIATQLRLAQEGMIKNKHFNKALEESESQNVDSLVLYSDTATEKDAKQMVYKYISDLASQRDYDLRTITNIGDWLDIPGYIVFEDGDKQYTSSIVRAINHLDCWKAMMTLNPRPTEHWPRDITFIDTSAFPTVALKDDQPECSACVMIKHEEDPGFVVLLTRDIFKFEENPNLYYNVLINKLPRFKRMYDRYDGFGIYYQIITNGSEERCRAKAREMLTKYMNDIRCLNFESGSW